MAIFEIYVLKKILASKLQNLAEIGQSAIL